MADPNWPSNSPLRPSAEELSERARWVQPANLSALLKEIDDRLRYAEDSPATDVPTSFLREIRETLAGG